MQSGLYYGYAAMCEGLIGRIRAELGEQARVVATGGFAGTLAPEIPAIETVDPVLTLVGLRLIFERNSAQPR
jgi:type III pantothenate kinase